MYHTFDEVRIVANNHSHGFFIGEIVTIQGSRYSDGLHYIAGDYDRGFWFVWPDEIAPINMNEQYEDYFAEIICANVICEDDECACFKNGGCQFYQIPEHELVKIARDRFIKKGCPEKLAGIMDIINKAYPERNVVF